jgi:hypothetical protein
MTPTAPPMTALTLDISFYIGDGIAGTKFSSTSLQVKGVGTNETKAYISALKRIRSTNPMLKNFINEGKSKIIEYYNSKCDFIIQDALSKSGMKKYDEGISSLLGVPEVCKECYNKSQDVAVSIYKKKMENECMERIQESKVAITNKNWDKAANLLGSILPDVSCYDESQTILKEIEDHRCSDALGKAQGAWSAMDAEQAGHWLSQISADSKCAEDANALGKEIKTKLKEDEDKEWDFKLKKQQDEVDVAKLSIEATREVGVAFGENSNLTTYNVKGWW